MIAPMAETGWEILTLRGLAATDERAEEFTGTLVIHRVGSDEPVESVSVRVKRSVVTELHESLGRVLTRSTAFRPNTRR
jgi:hypothetical protein